MNTPDGRSHFELREIPGPSAFGEAGAGPGTCSG